MLISEMHYSFKLGLDKEDSLAYANFIPREIDAILNEEQERLVKQRYGYNNYKQQSFEETQKRTDDLRTLVLNAILAPNSSSPNNEPNGVFIDLPNAAGEEYWFAIKESCLLNYIDCADSQRTKRVKVKTRQHDDLNEVVEDPFNQPDEDEVIRVMYQDKIEVITSPTTSVSLYYLRYIKKPRKVNFALGIDSELPDHLQLELIDSAVNRTLENIESIRYKTNISELNKTE